MYPIREREGMCIEGERVSLRSTLLIHSLGGERGNPIREREGIP